ncbi:hypothetical protein AT05_09630 [Schleiferia thermophila str. Yellowstone]|nr:hypothetical protein AT05_09630 [Schleiferia thermophila str. Yellowstone]
MALPCGVGLLRGTLRSRAAHRPVGALRIPHAPCRGHSCPRHILKPENEKIKLQRNASHPNTRPTPQLPKHQAAKGYQNHTTKKAKKSGAVSSAAYSVFKDLISLKKPWQKPYSETKALPMPPEIIITSYQNDQLIFISNQL